MRLQNGINNMKYFFFQTCSPLLISYETLALDFSKTIRLRKHDDVDGNSCRSNYNTAFTLLILNASILEGVLRSILIWKIKEEVETTIKERQSLGYDSPSKTENLLYKFREDVEHQGGWENLKNQYSLFLGISLESVMNKTHENTKEAINVLFTLRNILAHGTTIIQPKNKMPDDMKDVYPYKWQSKTQQASVYLNKQFNKGENILDNLSSNAVPEHFMNITKQFITKLKDEIKIPKESQEITNMIEKYTFGYRSL